MSDLNLDNYLDGYGTYLKSLIDSNSSELFTNQGINHASVLMAALFSVTKNEVRMYCQGFKPELIETEPYKDTLTKYLDNSKPIKVLVETDIYKDRDPLKKLIELRNNTDLIQIKQIKTNDKTNIDKALKGHCNFSIFDDDKYRLEIDPNLYKAIGSFNDSIFANVLISLFDNAFDNATDVA
jgi:hypothetical protein